MAWVLCLDYIEIWIQLEANSWDWIQKQAPKTQDLKLSSFQQNNPETNSLFSSLHPLNQADQQASVEKIHSSEPVGEHFKIREEDQGIQRNEVLKSDYSWDFKGEEECGKDRESDKAVQFAKLS